MLANAAANPSNTYAVAAAASLPPTDPLGQGNILIDTTAARELGLNAFAALDATVILSNAANFEYTGVATSATVDFMDVAAHELDETLEIGSALTGLPNNAAIPTDQYNPEDYFRYRAPARAPSPPALPPSSISLMTAAKPTSRSSIRPTASSATPTSTATTGSTATPAVPRPTRIYRTLSPATARPSPSASRVRPK